MRLAWILGAAVVTTSLAGGTITGALIAHACWGYVIAPPPMFPEVASATALRRFTAFHTAEDGRYVPTEADDQTAADRDDLMKALRAERILVEGTPGHQRSARSLSGVAIELADAGGEPFLLLVANSGQIENDHYARYEILLDRPGSTWNSKRWQRHFYAVAVVVALARGGRPSVAAAA